MTDNPDGQDPAAPPIAKPSNDPPTEVLPRVTVAPPVDDAVDSEPTRRLSALHEDWEPHDHVVAREPRGPRSEPPAHNAIRVAQDVAQAGRGPACAGSRWRRAADRVGSVLRVRESARQRARADLARRVQRPLSGDHRIAVVSLKGGVGKTTVAATLGSMLAAHRGDRVIAVDASPDFGTLAFRGPNENSAGVMDLLAAETISRYSDVRRYTSQTESRLEIVASQRNPAASETFSADRYSQLIDVVHRYYNIVVTDCGSGLTEPVMKGVLDETDVLVLVTSPAMDGATCAATALDWLSCHGYGYLADTATVVINVSRPGRPPMDTDQLVGFFRSRARAAHVIPYDRHLAEGGEVALRLMAKGTYDQVLELAASLTNAFPADGFGRPHAAGSRELSGMRWVDDDTTGTERRWS